MATIRFQALSDALSRVPKKVDYPANKASLYYSTNVFTQEVMREYLPSEAYKALMKTIEEGASLDRQLASQVASAMKDWALTKNVTHYTHWFQPLTGSTAEKHDSFFTPISGGRGIERFDGDNLVQQEPDASSFPNGGIRNTFEARGYTAWDPSSPAFIISGTLCIPTIFIAYTGEALDFKMPLLKALHAIDKAATDVCQYFEKDVTKVNVSLGWEQEYFLIDKALYYARPDIMMTGRALVGHNPAKGQQLDDHYFGSIPDRISAFMKEYEIEALKLGIPVTTRHNEVAPNQFECAPMFEETNLANDHNLLLMDLLEKIARKHDYRILLHEKPFPSLNGSGKHNNWSLGTNTGINLLAPGKNPKTNLRFLTFFVNTIKAIHDNADILRSSIASAGNDHRLGANEAPPAIVSVFIGSQLTQMLDNLEKSVKAGKMTPEDKTELKLSIGKIPQLLLDNTDRNRTSPFAFTGNKFEFRAVGSSANCGSAMIALNVIVAKQLMIFKKSVDARINKGEKKDEAILKELQKLIKESKKIRFEGNGYGEEWVKEAAKRGLSNLKDTPRALKIMVDKKTKSLFNELGVFSEIELEARYEIELENYILKLQIESRTLGDIAQNHIIPTAIKYQNVILENVKGMNELLGKDAKTLASTQYQILKDTAEHINKLKSYCDTMLEERKKANKIDDAEEKALAYCDNVKPYFEKIKYHSDKLELLID
ncbi:MAG: glutamine synthetase III, partial [Flavobacteriales bacterium]|nr:glutamine synthetase III [Flavobacteriales bacterium]